jgi:hypothetical protein
MARAGAPRPAASTESNNSESIRWEPFAAYSPAMDVTITSFAERPELTGAAAGTDWGPDEAGFMRGELGGRWGCLARLFSGFPEYNVVATDETGEVVACGGSIPFALGAPGRGKLPDAGWGQVLMWAFEDLQRGVRPDTAYGTEVIVRPGHRSRGLSGSITAALLGIARSRGFGELVSAVRPTEKHREPSVPMAEYAFRTRADGLPADAWLRANVRAGGEIVGVAPASKIVPGSLEQWRAWTGLPFDAEGWVVVPGALVPVYCALSHGYAIYTEPGVWLRFRLG